MRRLGHIDKACADGILALTHTLRSYRRLLRHGMVLAR